jgi:hypothetical protein
MPRRCSNAAFETKTYRPGAGAYGTLLDGAGSSLFYRFADMMLAHRPASNVVQPSVVRFTHYGVYGHHVLIPGQTQHVFDYAVSHYPNIECVGQHDRGLDISQLLDLGIAHKFAEGIAQIDCRRDFLRKEISRVGDDSGHSGSDVFSLFKRNMADLDPFDIGNPVQLPG